MDLSYGNLRDFKKCPKMFKLRVVDKLPSERDGKQAFVGGIIARILDAFYKERLWRLGGLRAGDAMEARIPEAAAAVNKKDKIFWLPEEDLPHLTRAACLIPGIIATIKAEKLIGDGITVSEHELVIAHGPHTIHGRTDLVFERGNVLTALDAKAGGTIGRFTDTDQLRLYALGIEADPLFKRFPDRIGFWWVRHSQIVWKRITPKTLTTFWEGVKTRVAAIERGAFDPTPGTVCKLCDYRMGCTEGQVYLTGRPRETAYASEAVEGYVSL